MGSHSIAGSRILLVEDEALFGVDLAMTLEERGFVVSGPLRHMATARAEISAGSIDLALLDIELGAGMTSFDIARVLQAHGVPYIFVSGHAPSSVELPADLSFFARMTKPVDVPNLLVLMHDALGSQETAGRAKLPIGDDSGRMGMHRLV